MTKKTLLAMAVLTCTACAQAQQANYLTTTGSRSLSLREATAKGKEATPTATDIVLNPGQTYQTIDGFGYAITYSSCYNLLKMSAEDRAQLLKKTYSMTEGYGVSYARISLGCNDFSSTEYSLCDEKGPDNDLLKNFRLYKDETDYVIPILKEILAINPDLKIIAAPWTCPKWMKVTTANGSTLHDRWTDGHLRPAYYKTYAEYFVKFIEAFQKEGINIYAVSPQNEPLNAGNCASLYMPWNEQAAFVRQLAPTLKQAGLQTKIYLFDHNYNYDNKQDQQQYPVKIYRTFDKNADFEGQELVVGAAYHNYGGSTDELNVIHDLYPDKELLFTEASIGTWNNGRNLDSSLEDNMVNVGLNTVLKHCVGVLVWNFMLDWNRGPNLDGGCQTCFGAIDIADDYKSYTFNSHYYTIAHLSAVVRPGAVRIDASLPSLNGVTLAAFRNPDGTLGVVAYNRTSNTITTRVNDGKYSWPLILQPRGVVSALLSGGATAAVRQPQADMAQATADGYYTLQGTKVDTPTLPGIYIHQGRKEFRQ